MKAIKRFFMQMKAARKERLARPRRNRPPGEVDARARAIGETESAKMRGSSMGGGC